MVGDRELLTRDRPLIVGERINAQGSRAVRQMLLTGDYDGIVAIARAQVDAGAHALDVHVGLAGHDDEADQMERVVARLVTAVDVPLAIDSTDPLVVERALALVPDGRAIVNSVHLARRAALDQLVPLATSRNAAVVALCFDEQGLARTRQRKLDVARRLHDVIVERHGFPPDRLLIDALTFPLATAGAGEMVETIEAVRLIKRALPRTLTILGISDVSFGLPPGTRGSVNSIFLRRCLEAGLDAAIANPALFGRA